MPDKTPEDRPLGIKGMLGVGLDAADGHERLTRGRNFTLVGGSEETHERMQETAVRFNESVDKRGKPLEKITGRELEEIVTDLKDKLDS